MSIDTTTLPGTCILSPGADPDDCTTHSHEGDGSVEDLFGPIIHSYSRADAIRDGVLVDVAEPAAEAGIVWPVAMTAAAYADTVTWTEQDEARKPFGTGQDFRGRLWDVLTMTAYTMRAQARSNADVRAGSRLRVTLVRIPREGRGVTPRKTELHAHIGPDDNGRPCITLMLPNED